MSQTITYPELETYDLSEQHTIPSAENNIPNYVYSKTKVDAIIQQLLLEKEQLSQQVFNVQKLYYKLVIDNAEKELSFSSQQESQAITNIDYILKHPFGK